MTRIIRAIQLTPFVYSVIFVIVFTTYNFVGEQVQDNLDLLFYVSPLVVVVFIVYSYILHLCNWYRVMCIIPLIPPAVSQIDMVFIFTQREIMGINLMTIILSALLIISAYKVFWHGREQGSRRAHKAS